MSYIVSWKDEDGTTGSYKDYLFSQAISDANNEAFGNKDLISIGISSILHDEVSVVSDQNGLEVWNSHDSPALRKYEEYSNDNWKSLQHGHHKSSNKPSVYFDIDGTLGKWYSDGRGFAMEELLDPINHYFRDIEPHEVMIDLAKQLQANGVDVCIISAAEKDTIRDKWEWVEEYLPFVPRENICFAPIGADKSKFVKDNAEISVLIDDYNNNLEEWKGTAIKAINTVNSHQNKFAEIDFTKQEAILAETKNDLEIEKIVENVAEKVENIITEIVSKNMQNEIHAESLKEKYADTNIADICEELAKHDETKQLTSWFGDYALYEPALGVKKEELLEAYDSIMETKENLYETFKKEWIDEHIDDITMTDTQSLYENIEESKNMTFNEYVEEYGFSDGSVYPSFEEFCDNEFPVYELAETIEQFMYERGEYEYPDDDTIRWIDKDSREETTKNIRHDLERNYTLALSSYLEDEISYLEDESLLNTEKLYSVIERFSFHNAIPAEEKTNSEHNNKKASAKKQKVDIDLD